MNTAFLKAHDLMLQEVIAAQPVMSESEFLEQASTTAQPINMESNNEPNKL